MSALTLADIERELLEMADDLDAYDEGTEPLRMLARRIAVQIEADKLARAA